jgi:hypothetical protein
MLVLGGGRVFDGKGLVKMLLIHMGPTEFLYYWLHRY